MAWRQGKAADASESSGSGGSPAWTVDDQAEWERFFADHYVKLLTAGIGWGGDQRDADDAVSVAMLELNQRWHQVRNRAAYTRRVVLNYVTYAQRGEREKIKNLIAAGAFVDASYDDHELNRHEDAQWVHGLFDQLPREQRRVMENLYDGLTTAEIAEALGKSEANVRKHLQLARDRLKTALTKEGYRPRTRRTLAALLKEVVQ